MTFKKISSCLNLIVCIVAMLAVGAKVCDAADDFSIPLDGAVDQAFQVDFKGDGQEYSATVSGDMTAGYRMRIFRDGEDELFVSIRPGFGEIMVVSLRDDGKQDIAYVVNNGSGNYIQSFNIIGYDGKTITYLANIDALKAEGIKQGRLKHQENKLYLFFSKAESGYFGPESKRPIKQYTIPFVWAPEANQYVAGEANEQ